MTAKWLALASLLLSLTGSALAVDVGPRCQDATLLGCVAGETWSGTHNFGSATVQLPANAVDAITEIAAGIKSGNGGNLVTTTGTQTSGNCVSIDANGNHVASGSACGTGTVAWNSIGDAAAGGDIDMSTFAQTMNWGVIPATTIGLRLLDGASIAGNRPLLNVTTGLTSTMYPVEFTAQGTANGVRMETTGRLIHIGSTGGIRATDLSFASQAQGDLARYNGATWERLPAGTSSQVLHGGTAPSFSAVVSGDITDGTITSADISDSAFFVWADNLGSSGNTSRSLGAAAREVGTNRHAVLLTANGLVLQQVAGGSEGVNTFSVNATNDTALTFGQDPGTVIAYYELP